MSLETPANAVHDDSAADSRPRRPEPTNRLESFPPGATLAPALATLPEQSVHVGELILGEGVTIIVAMRDLVEDVDGLKPVTRAEFADLVNVVTLVGLPAYVEPKKTVYHTPGFRDHLSFAQMVGGAKGIFTPSHDLAVLLGVETRGRALRNRYLVVRDGAIVWSSTSDPRDTNKRHDASGLAEAVERALSASE